MYKISIIMPCFNVEQYIERSFKSILNQTMDLEDIEVIMVDDCSTDNTRNIINEYANKYSNFKALFHEKNSGGCAMPRNTGLEIATGKYIMFLDPDDEYVPDMCEVMYNKIEESDVDLVKCNYIWITPASSELHYSYDESIDEVKVNCKEDLPPEVSSVWSGIHKKSFLNKNNIKFEDLTNGEEFLFTLTEYVNLDVLIYLNHYHGYKYYLNETISHASRPTKKHLDAFINSYHLINELLESNNRQDIIKVFFSTEPTRFFLRVMDYDKNKEEYLKRYYEFEKNLTVEITMNHLWLDILNKLLMKRHFRLCILYIDVLNLFRNSPLVKIYREHFRK